jgi:ubiquitin
MLLKASCEGDIHEYGRKRKKEATGGTAKSKEQRSNSRHQTAHSAQQAVAKRHQTADRRKQTAGSRQQTAGSRQHTADSIQQTAYSRHAPPAAPVVLSAPALRSP